MNTEEVIPGLVIVVRDSDVLTEDQYEKIVAEIRSVVYGPLVVGPDPSLGLIPDAEVYGESMQGRISNITYREMVRRLGLPNAEGDGYKTDCNWGIRGKDGGAFGVWNYKNGPNYNHTGSVEDIDFWSIGFPHGKGTNADRTLAQAVFGDHLTLE